MFFSYRCYHSPCCCPRWETCPSSCSSGPPCEEANSTEAGSVAPGNDPATGHRHGNTVSPWCAGGVSPGGHVRAAVHSRGVSAPSPGPQPQPHQCYQHHCDLWPRRHLWNWRLRGHKAERRHDYTFWGVAHDNRSEYPQQHKGSEAEQPQRAPEKVRGEGQSN